MRFKDWLITEDDGFDGPGGTSWDILYPSIAGDYSDAVKGPREHLFLQWKWNRGLDKDVGRRPLYNIDNKEFQQRKYTTIESPCAPDTSEGFWKHKPDDESGYLKPVYNVDLIRMGYGKTSKDVKEIEGWNFCCNPFGSTTPNTDAGQADARLDNIFGDGDTHTHKWPDLDLDYMDKPWTKANETIMHGGIQMLPGQGINTGLPVRSKTVATDGHKMNRDNCKFDNPRKCKKDKEGNNPEKPEEGAPEKFGFRRPEDKEEDKERMKSWIHKKERSTPIRVQRVYT
jgi:hypothetical protein